MTDSTFTPAQAAGMTREAVSRIIDPLPWYRKDAGYPHDLDAGIIHQSLVKADAILALGAQPSAAPVETTADRYVHIDNVVYHLDDIEVNADGKCAWADVANALTHIKLCIEIRTAPLPLPRSSADTDDAGDAATLRGFIKTYGMTPSMMASDRDRWHRVAMEAGAITCVGGGHIYPLRDEVKKLRAQVERLTSTGPQTSTQSPADAVIAQIEERFPNWQSYRDLVDCIDYTLHDLRRGE